MVPIEYMVRTSGKTRPGTILGSELMKNLAVGTCVELLAALCLAGCGSSPDLPFPGASPSAGDGAAPAAGPAEVRPPPPRVPQYGIWEARVLNSRPYQNSFKYEVISLDAIFTSPSGREISFWGFYDGDGRGGQEGDTWKVRFMPDEVGTWRYALAFSDGTQIPGAEGSFEAVISELSGPARLDPSRPDLLVDARGRPIHWRGYAIKHRLYREPLDAASARSYIEHVIEPLIVEGGYNATYFAVPSGDNADRAGRPRRGTQSLWGDFETYDLQAAHFTDALLESLRENDIWTIGWITFSVQSSWDDLWEHHREWIRYFVARYGAYYNYFLWSPCWELAELKEWVHRTGVMMGFAASIDPWNRLLGVHDRVRREWETWQSIHARQNPTRTLAGGNNRKTGVDAALAPYRKVIIGAEDIWEMAAGHFGQPRNGEEVRRGLWGELLASVLPMYDENDDFAPPVGGVGHGEGEKYVKIAYDWWYDRVDYRDPEWRMLNDVLPARTGQRCSGIPGREYVAYREGNGPITIRLGADAGSFYVSWLNPSTGQTWENESLVTAGGIGTLEPPFRRDDVVVHLHNAAAEASR
jgi:hypothetical protein